MSTTKQNNPNVDFGFHAVIPRIVRTHYPELSPLQKWFYACLKDLCGDHGTCYRTVRVLSQETGLSTGMVSESIPALHKAGLIHAEKKRRSSGGKEVWHITIVDIWKANGEAHPTKRSHSEQECSPHEHIQGNVHHMNKNVHHMNDNAQECSPHEQECSHSETEVITLSNNNIEAITEKQDNVIDVTAHADVVTTSPAPLSQPLQEKKRATRKKPQPPTEQKEIPFEEMPWCAEKALTLTEKLVDTKYRNQENEVKACREIFKKYNPTEEAYVRVVQKILPWYQDHKKLLHPTDLAAKTQRGRIRFEELLEEIEYQDSRPARPTPTNTNGMTTKHGQRPEDYENSEISRNNTNHIRQLLADRRAKREAANTKGA